MIANIDIRAISPSTHITLLVTGGTESQFRNPGTVEEVVCLGLLRTGRVFGAFGWPWMNRTARPRWNGACPTSGQLEVWSKRGRP